MPQVNISWSRNAGDSNYLYGMPGGTIGPNSGSRTANVGWNQVFNLSANGSGPGNVAMRRLNSQTLGLDDRQGAGADNDFNDMIIYVNGGQFINDSQFRGPTPVYGCTNSGAINYNPNADLDDGSCVVVNPILNLDASPNPIIKGQSTTLSWSTSDSEYIQTANIDPAPGAVNTSGSAVVTPIETTTYVYTVTWANGSRQTSRTVTVYVPPEITVSLDNSPIILGETTTLRWSTTGDASTMTIDPGIGSTLLSSAQAVTPTQDTTYTLTATGPGGTDTEQITLTVIQPPELDLTGPLSIPYGQSTVDFSYEAVNALSIDVSIIQRDLDNSDDFFTDTAATDGSVYTYEPTWGNRGPQSILVTMTANGQGGLQTIRQSNVPVNIDQTPNAIDIPSTEDKLRGEEPVITPDVEVVSDQIVIEDIDIPVEVKADYPIQVEIDNSNVWYNVQEL